MSDPIIPNELKSAFLWCVKQAQDLDFKIEICALQKNHPLRISSKLYNLRVSLDEDGLLRVGGRLQQSNLSYEERHPVILDGKNHLVSLVIEWAHKHCLHGGASLTYSCAL